MIKNTDVSSKELCLFLSQYAVRLLGCGATCIRLEKNVSRIAGRFGCKADFTIMPGHISMSVCSGDDNFTSVDTVRNSAIDFDLNTRLSRLSWRIADSDMSLDQARRIFSRLVRQRSENPYLVLVLVSLANASFCRLFGGDLIAMAVVFVATFAGFYVKQLLLARKMDTRVVVIICSFISSVLGATDMLFSLGSTPAVAIGTSVLYLVPGIPFINSFSDILYRHYICAFSRFVDASVITACLSIGLCAGMMLMGVGMF